MTLRFPYGGYSVASTSKTNSKYNIVSRIFEYDLKFGSNIENVSSMMRYSRKLQRLVFSTYIDFTNVGNTSLAFSMCENLVMVYGAEINSFAKVNGYLHQMFDSCRNCKEYVGSTSFLPASTNN